MSAPGPNGAARDRWQHTFGRFLLSGVFNTGKTYVLYLALMQAVPYRTGPHLVQLATDAQVFLFPVVCALNHSVLREVLPARQVIKAGFGLGNDRSALRSRLDIELNNVLDLGELLRGPGHRGTVGAKVAVAHYFGEKLIKSKRESTSNTDNPPLNEPQLLYAANDAHVALKIYHAWLADPSHHPTNASSRETS